MKYKVLNTPFSLAAAGLLIGILGSPPASAKAHREHTDGQIISQMDVPAASATELFLRTSAAGRMFLYITDRNHTISMLDVTNAKEPKEADELFSVQSLPKVHLLLPDTDAIIAAVASGPSQQWTVLDENAAGVPQIAKQFAHVDAYVVDGGRNRVYAVEKGKLSVFQFDRPLTNDAEIWEQWYESR